MPLLRLVSMEVYRRDSFYVKGLSKHTTCHIYSLKWRPIITFLLSSKIHVLYFFNSGEFAIIKNASLDTFIKQLPPFSFLNFLPLGLCATPTGQPCDTYFRSMTVAVGKTPSWTNPGWQVRFLGSGRAGVSAIFRKTLCGRRASPAMRVCRGYNQMVIRVSRWFVDGIRRN
mgnify:CR=1 FL=1